MDAGGIREIANMQCKIDQYEFFLTNLVLWLRSPDKDFVLVETGDETCSWIWSEIDKLQKQLKEYECKASTSD